MTARPRKKPKASAGRALMANAKTLLTIAGILIAAFYLISPAYWMIKSSVSHDLELRAVPPTLLPQHLTFKHFRVILQIPDENGDSTENVQFQFFPRATLNSLIVSLGTTVLATALGAVFAYSISRFVSGRPRRWIMFGLLLSRMLPLIAVLIPIYMILLTLGLLDTLHGLTLVYTGLLLPFAIWILEAFFRSFPRELEEAAVMDGATPFQVFTRVVLPLSWNGLFAAGVFVFISTWADFVVGFVMTNTERAYPISVVIARNMSSWRDLDWGVLNAAGVVAAAVPVILAFILRGLFARGQFSGAIKG